MRSSAQSGAAEPNSSFKSKLNRFALELDLTQALGPALMRRLVRNVLLTASVGLWLLSLTFVGFLTKQQPVFGAELLVGGWAGALSMQFGWFANPAYFYGLYSLVMYEPTRARWASGIALFLALSSLDVDQYWHNEGYPTAVIGVGLGFYMWAASIALLALVAFVLPLKWRAATAAGRA